MNPPGTASPDAPYDVHPTPAFSAYRRLALALEFCALFVGLPLLFYFEPLPIPKLPSLILITAICRVSLRRDTTFDLRDLCKTRPLRAFVPGMLLRALVVAVALSAFVFWIDPALFLAFPRTRPRVWGFVVLLYPFLSALPQEFIYRSFLYHRYAPLFGTKLTRLAASAMAFSFLHIMYDNVFAIVSTLIAGVLLSLTYQRSRSLLVAFAEHTLYGWIVFTVGLGFCFFEGH